MWISFALVNQLRSSSAWVHHPLFLLPLIFICFFLLFKYIIAYWSIDLKQNMRTIPSYSLNQRFVARILVNKSQSGIAQIFFMTWCISLPGYTMIPVEANFRYSSRKDTMFRASVGETF